jgi:hypothetical protein
MTELGKTALGGKDRDWWNSDYDAKYAEAHTGIAITEGAELAPDEKWEEWNGG